MRDIHKAVDCEYKLENVLNTRNSCGKANGKKCLHKIYGYSRYNQMGNGHAVVSSHCTIEENLTPVRWMLRIVENTHRWNYLMAK
jgi:hypothetical protein